MKSHGHFYAKTTGYFSPTTNQAVINYQIDRNLPVDGIVGPETARQITVDKVLSAARRFIGITYKRFIGIPYK